MATWDNGYLSSISGSVGGGIVTSSAVGPRAGSYPWNSNGSLVGLSFGGIVEAFYVAQPPLSFRWSNDGYLDDVHSGFGAGVVSVVDSYANVVPRDPQTERLVWADQGNVLRAGAVVRMRWGAMGKS